MWSVLKFGVNICFLKTAINTTEPQHVSKGNLQIFQELHCLFTLFLPICVFIRP